MLRRRFSIPKQWQQHKQFSSFGTGRGALQGKEETEKSGNFRKNNRKNKARCVRRIPG